ncbi:MAG: ATP-binding protein [Chloroflexi bacterium]|nr:ATP-binding protein [Chloroflexota bacterium]
MVPEFDDLDLEDIEDMDIEEEVALETPSERFLEAIGPGRKVRLKKHQTAVSRFLGKGKRADATVIKPGYYGELLAWSLQRHIEKDGWSVARTLPYNRPSPRYVDVHTSFKDTENLLRDGTLLLVKGDDSLAVTIEINPHAGHSVVVTGLASKEDVVTGFAAGVEKVSKEENFYRGQKLGYHGRIYFLEPSSRTWDSIALDEALKEEIKSNTVGFLARSDELAGYGIPARRGVLLVGEPGTGKTLICKALLSDSEVITCLVANSYLVERGDYISALYELAQDLSPSIVFIEDIDLIGQKRLESGRGPALMTLLTIMDGVEEQKRVVTVATTNYLEVLDKALGQRPARFDRIIELSRPGVEERRKLVAALCRKAPIAEETQDYIVRHTETCTPAQVQEVIYSLVIRRVQNNGHSGVGIMGFTGEEVEWAIKRAGRGNGTRMGFCRAGGLNNR